MFDKAWKCLFLLSVLALAFSIYQLSLNNRYTLVVENERVVHVLDTRTGITYAYFSVGDENGEIWINNAPKGTMDHKQIKSAHK